MLTVAKIILICHNHCKLDRSNEFISMHISAMFSMSPEKSTMENQVYHLPVKCKQNMVSLLCFLRLLYNNRC